MRTSFLLWTGIALVATALAANADNRVAPSYKGAPHVHNMTTPGWCPEGYNPGLYNGIKQCIRCDYDSTYYASPYPAVCASCPEGYTYDPVQVACFPNKPK